MEKIRDGGERAFLYLLIICNSRMLAISIIGNFRKTS